MYKEKRRGNTRQRIHAHHLFPPFLCHRSKHNTSQPGRCHLIISIFYRLPPSFLSHPRHHVRRWKDLPPLPCMRSQQDGGRSHDQLQLPSRSALPRHCYILQQDARASGFLPRLCRAEISCELGRIPAYLPCTYGIPHLAQKVVSDSHLPE